MEARFYINENVAKRPEFKADLDSLKISYEYKEIPGIGDKEGWKYIRFSISENDPLWPTIHALLKKHGLKAGQRVIYSKQDIETAEWFRVHPDSASLGYPKPDHDNGYMQATYDLSKYCLRCGIGEQIGPFRLSSEPKSKSKHFLGIEWIPEEIFARVEIQAVFENLGITGVEYLRPVKHRTGEAFESIAQLKVNTVLPPALVVHECELVTCCENNEEDDNKPVNRLRSLINTKELNAKRESSQIASYNPADVWSKRYPPDYPLCGRIKYHVIYRHQAKFAREAFRGAPDFVKTNEWFGSGGHAGRETLVSQRVARVILENKWRGVRLEPIALV